MSNSDDLLKYEADVIEHTRRAFHKYHPRLMEVFDNAMGLYTTFGKMFGQSQEDSPDLVEFAVTAKLLGAADTDDIDPILATPTTNPEQLALRARLKTVAERCESRTLRGIVLLLMGRAFSRSVADLLRQRLTTALGLQRFVVEGLALLFLFRDDPAKAIEWRSVLGDKQGIAYNRKYNQAISWIIRGAKLKKMHNTASGTALHVRLASAVGLNFKTSVRGARRIDETRVLYGELRPGEEFFFFTQVVQILRTQVRVFNLLNSAIPEADDAIWTNVRVPQFTALVVELSRRLHTAFPEDARRIRMRGAMGLLGEVEPDE